MAEPGYNFTPGLANRFRSALNGQANQLGANATQALQILSLHLPDVIGGHAPAPDALLRGGAGIRPDAAVRTMTSGQSATQPPAAPRPSPLSSVGQNQPPLSITSPAPSFAAPAGASAAPEQASAAPTIDTGGGGGGAPNPFPTQTPEPTPTPTTPSAPGVPKVIFKGPDQEVQQPTGPPPNIDFQNLMDTLFGSGFGQSIYQGGNYGNYGY